MATSSSIGDTGTVTSTLDYTSILSDILLELQAIDENTDGIEVSLTQIITDIQSGNATLVAIDIAIDSLLPELQSVNANTDTLEASFTQVVSDLQEGNVDLASIEVLLTSSLTELQSINTNTDTVESLITTLINTVTTENDQTQVLLSDIETTLNAIEILSQSTPVAEVADGVDIPDSSTGFVIPVSTVRTFTVSKDGPSSVVINTPSGTVTMQSNGTRKFGSGRENSVLTTANYTIDTGIDSQADVIWEI